MRSRILTHISAILLISGGLLSAQTSASPASPQQPAPGGHMMGHSMMGGHAQGGSMMEECKAMMAKRQAMMDQMEAMDAKIDSLVQAMNAAQGSDKIDATAAVVTELVAQRTAMREHMHSMQSMMMQHMMKHMEGMEGMKGMKGMKESMGQCPMMQEEMTEESGHDQHH